nr:integrase, catalytic region, zinc finger, CCHC-type, peptidase aspartic, catalytic [Tanacetum cinerariifolium]
MKRIIKEQVKGQVKEQVSKILPRIEQSMNAQLEVEVLTMSSHSSRTSYAVAADLLEIELKKILIEKMEGNKECVILKRRRDDDDDDDQGLVQKSSSLASYVPPSRNDWDLLFQPMFDELLNPPPSVDNQAAEVIAPIAEVIPQVDDDSTGSPSSTIVDQDAPSPTHMGNDQLLGVPIPEVTAKQSSSMASPQSNVQPNHPMTHHNSKWTKDHPLNYIIGPLSRPVSTRLQLHEQALFCYYDAFLTSVEPKTYKEALTQACWIEAMQEKLNEFEHLE